MTLILERYDGDPDRMVFPIMGHLSSTREAVLHLRTSLERFAAKTRGTVELIHPEHLHDDTWGVRWIEGPLDWAKKFAADEDCSAAEFDCVAENGYTIFFKESE